MIVAREKRKNNIAEFVLYMWQIEDTLRAFEFDINLIEERFISHFKQSAVVMDEIRDWYANIILSMHEEGIRLKGHLRMVTSVVDELFELHKRLISETQDAAYIESYKAAKPNIEVFKTKLEKAETNEIEICFNALYGLLLLRLKKETVTKDTQDAMASFSKMLALLSDYFKKVEEGKVEF
jgi:hypothetical protein